MRATVAETGRHKVFVSFHHEDQKYKDHFVRVMAGGIVDKSVEDDDIDDANLKTDTIRRKIRDDFIADATVTVVLIGPCTWQRKHVDWEIGSSLRNTKKNPRCGLLGVLLPNHPDFGREKFRPRLIPPRLADNCNGDDPYAGLYDWSNRTLEIRSWIHEAYERKLRVPHADNSRRQFGRNRQGNCSTGWQN